VTSAFTPSEHPLFEFDPTVDAVINPSIHGTSQSFPRRAVTCWFGNVVRERTEGAEPVYHVPFEHGDHAIHVVEHAGEQVALVSPGVGAPAAVTSLEVMIALGATKIIGCGGAGAAGVHGGDGGAGVSPVACEHEPKFNPQRK
jgi:hypothetical protein